MSEHVEALVCLSALPYGSYVKEMLQLGSLYRLANFYVNKQLNGRGDLCRNEERQMNEWGLFTLWMVSSCCAKFNFLLKAVLTSQQWHWRTGGLWLWWRWGTSHGWLGAGGMTQDLCVERAAGTGAFLTGGACHFPKGCNTRCACSHAGFTRIWLGFTSSAFAIVPSVLENSELSWCSKTLKSSRLVLFSRKSSRTALLPSPPPSSQRCTAFIWPQGLGRCMPAERGSTSKQSACLHDSYGGEGMLAAWPLLRSALPLPLVGTRCVIWLQVSVGLGGCALFRKSSWRGLYKVFRSKPPGMRSHLCLGVVTRPDEVR